MRKRWQVEAELADVPDFDVPRAELEQYITPPHLAAHLASAVEDDVADRTVIDLGCGTGMLCHAATQAGAAHIVGVELDEAALATARQTLPDEVDLVRADVLALGWRRCADVVLTNPPFGTKRRGVDIAFLATACNAARSAVYSMHKASTRAYVARCAQAWGVRHAVVATMRYELPRTYRFHKAAAVDIDVDLWRLQLADDTPLIDATRLPQLGDAPQRIGRYNVPQAQTQDRRGRGRGQSRARGRRGTQQTRR